MSSFKCQCLNLLSKFLCPPLGATSVMHARGYVHGHPSTIRGDRSERAEGRRKRDREEVMGRGADLTRRGVTPPLSLTGGCHGERAGPEQRGIQWEMTLLVSPW